MCRKHEEDIRDTHAETNHINQVIIEKDAVMAELKRQVAQGRSPIAGASSSAKGGASSSQQPDSKAGADDDSPKSNMSSPWGTDVSLPGSASLLPHQPGMHGTYRYDSQWRACCCAAPGWS